MMLDANIGGAQFTEKLAKFGLSDYLIYNGYDFVKHFAVQRTPYLVCLDAALRVSKHETMRMVGQLV